jgi:hypothetical protein
VRFPEDRIKEAIHHPDPEIRARAVAYFARSHSPDPAVMGLVIKAVERYGRRDATGLVGPARHLRQTEGSVAWVVGELNDGRDGWDEDYGFNLSMVLLEAHPALLLLKEAAILSARHFLPDLRSALSERLRMTTWDEATCWSELEGFCEAASSEEDASKTDLGHARRVVEALARFGGRCDGKVRALLEQKVEDYRHDPMAWMEPLAVRLAGLARLESTVPLIVAKLLGDGGDVLNEECAEALTRVGTPAVLHAVAGAFPTAELHFRIYATGPLENIHSDLAVETCLSLLRQEADPGIRVHLAQALLAQFASEAIEEARRLLVRRDLDFEERGLRDYLLETCALTGERFPEYDEWWAASKAEREEHRRRVGELEDDPVGLLRFALEKLTGKAAAGVPRPPSPTLPGPTLPRQPEKRQRVGRNDPCPCGSGKKFKVCCGRR